MGCTKALDFAAPPGAHLSFYWNMDEGGTSNKIDQTHALPWPIAGPTNAAPGLFVNGTHLFPTATSPLGLRLVSSATVTTSTTKGISFWFWLQTNGFGTVGPGGQGFTFDIGGFDTNPASYGDLALSWFSAASPLGFTLDHTNSDPVPGVQASGTVPIVFGAWHMLAGTLDLVNKQLKLYIDGVLVDTQVDTLAFYPSTALSLYRGVIGLLNCSTTMTQVGDELGLCLDGVLTQAQITSLWNGGVGVTWPGVTAIVPFP